MEYGFCFAGLAGGVVIKKQGGDLVVQVHDTGIGISAEFHKRIFTSGFRGEIAKSINGNGKGLGLAMVQQEVEKMGGTVKVDSEPGKGACFTVTIPGEFVD